MPGAVKYGRRSQSVTHSVSTAGGNNYFYRSGCHVMLDDNMILLESVASIVAAYVGNNTIPKENLGQLISEIHRSLARTGQRREPVEELKPAVSIKRSVQPDHIVCLEDGKKFKSLKRHLSSHYNMTPQEYREKWGLPHDYPMVAPSYTQRRSELAKKSGLGQRKSAVEVVKGRGGSDKKAAKAKGRKAAVV